MRCSNQLSTDASGVFSVARVRAILAHPDLVRVLAEAPVLLGFDARLVDGTVLELEVGGRRVLAGGECRRAGRGCRPIPPGVLAAVAFIRELASHQLEQHGCAPTEPGAAATFN
jgi:hypothetical protein